MEKMILAFKIARGGKFNNSGYLYFLGDKNIGEFTNDLFIVNNEYVTFDGNKVGLTDNDCYNGIGKIDIDGDYNTIYTKYSDELSEKEFEAILREKRWNTDTIVEKSNYALNCVAYKTNATIFQGENGAYNLSLEGFEEYTLEEAKEFIKNELPFTFCPNDFEKNVWSKLSIVLSNTYQLS
jgi:hypothetical protein